MQTNNVFEIKETMHLDITFLKKSIISIVEAMTYYIKPYGITTKTDIIM